MASLQESKTSIEVLERKFDLRVALFLFIKRLSLVFNQLNINSYQKQQEHLLEAGLNLDPSDGKIHRSLLQQMFADKRSQD